MFEKIEDLSEIDRIKNFFSENKVRIIKMNHTLKDQG